MYKEDKIINWWQKLLRRVGLVRYSDFMRCRDALSKIGQSHMDDEWVQDILDTSTFICDYPKVVKSYPSRKDYPVIR